MLFGGKPLTPPEALPEDVAAEQSLLGAMLIEAAAIEAAQGLVSCADFTRPGHQVLFDALTTMHRAGQPADFVTVQAELKKRDALEAVGGTLYLVSLFEATPTAANALHYAGIVADKARQGRLLKVNDWAKAQLLSGVSDTDAFFAEFQARLARASEGSIPKKTDWEPPMPFSGFALPAFPTEALPPALAGIVGEMADSVRVPPEWPAMLGLAAFGAAAARRCLVQIGDTHTEPLNLYVAVVGEPGGRKTAALEPIAAPLRDFERDMIQSALPLIAAAAEERAVAEKRQGYLRDAAAKEKNAEKREELTRALLDAGPIGEVPAAPKLLADDVTPEKLAALCAEQGGCMAMFSAEGGIFGILAGRYSDGKANLDLFLKGHAGEDVRVDRKSGPPVHIRRARLSLGLAVQPSLLASLSDTPSFRGRGLLGRFLYALPEDLAGTRIYQNRPIDPAARAAYESCIRSVLALPALAGDDPDALHVLRIEGAALNVWAEHHDDVERRQAEGRDLAGIRDWASKLAGAVARIAGGFHLAQWAAGGRPWEHPVSEQHVLSAWAVGEYLVPHALAAYGHIAADPALMLAQRILRWIRRSAAESGGVAAFSLRDCQRAHSGGSKPLAADAIQAALTLLTDRGYIRPERTFPGGGGRPKSPTFAVNPATFEDE